jgi:hypothetical protein
MDKETAFKELGIEIFQLSDRVMNAFLEKYPELDDSSSQIIAGALMLSLLKLASLLKHDLRFVICHNAELMVKKIRDMDSGASNIK